MVHVGWSSSLINEMTHQPFADKTLFNDSWVNPSNNCLTNTISITKAPCSLSALVFISIFHLMAKLEAEPLPTFALLP